MQLANQEAWALGHDHVDTDHILLGLIAENGGIAAEVLKSRDLDLDSVRDGVKGIVASTDGIVRDRELPLTPSAIKVIETCHQETDKFKDRVDTEHLLLGLMCQPDSVGCQVLLNLGADFEDILVEVLKRSESV